MTTQRTMRSPNRSYEKGPVGRIWTISKRAGRTSRYHCCTKFSGCPRPPLRYDYTTRWHLCSLKNVSKWYQWTGSQMYTFSPNWFAVPSMQTMRFLPPILCWHSLLPVSEVLTKPAVAYERNIGVVRQRTNADEIIPTFLAFDRIVRHGVKGSGYLGWNGSG